MPKPPTHTIQAGIYGASGATGTELTAVLTRHPLVEISFATSRKCSGQTTRDIDPAVPEVPLIDPDDAEPGAVDVVFTCLPHGQAAPWVKHCDQQGTRVIDLSGDLRLKDAAAHRKTYGTPRSEELAARAVYGLTEFARDEIAEADIVSCPGCYPTCIGLALAPAARAGLIRGTVSVFAQSGVSGAGRRATADTHFCSVTNDVRPYKIGRVHRHVPEIEQVVTGLAPADTPASKVIFCPQVIPIERGMLATIVLEQNALTPLELQELYVAAYAEEPFVEVCPHGAPARVRSVVGTNRATIGLHDVDQTGQFVVTCAIDNLLKGAAGQAVQNMNAMFGLTETFGLGLTFSDAAVTQEVLGGTA